MPSILKRDRYRPLSFLRDHRSRREMSGKFGMYIRRMKGPQSVTLPDGSVLTRADLPSPTTRRWVASRKATVVMAVESGLIEEAEALSIWGLSEEELASWRAAITRHGIAALKATAVQKYRS